MPQLQPNIKPKAEEEAKEAWKVQEAKAAKAEDVPVGIKVGVYICGRPLPVFPDYSTQKVWPAGIAA